MLGEVTLALADTMDGHILVRGSLLACCTSITAHQRKHRTRSTLMSQVQETGEQGQRHGVQET